MPLVATTPEEAAAAQDGPDALSEAADRALDLADQMRAAAAAPEAAARFNAA